MLSPDLLDSKPKKLLIITSSGGGGLIQAANAKEQEARMADPRLTVVRKDILKDWMGNIFGGFCSKLWNSAQMKGKIAALRCVISSQHLFDYLFWLCFFFRALRTLFKEDVDQIIDTQPLATSAIIHAIRIYNWKQNKHVRLQKVLVDLPTNLATHFFRPIKKLSKNNRPYLQLTTIAPLLEGGQTAEDFWQTNCRLSEKEIHYTDVNVRQAFRKFQHKQKSAQEFPVFLRFQNDDELRLMKQTFEKGSLLGSVHGDAIRFSLSPKDWVITILLGSQPASESTFNYIKKFIQFGQGRSVPKHLVHIFVFCSEYKPLGLFRKVADHVVGSKNYPKHVTIIPFSFQKDDCLAPLFFRSDLTCTRSGGQTAMELMCVSTGETWVHSERKKDPGKEDFLMEQLLEGIPGWEAANALYLKKVRDAKIVTPDIIEPLAVRFFQTNRHV